MQLPTYLLSSTGDKLRIKGADTFYKLLISKAPFKGLLL